MQGSTGSALNHNQILVTSPDLDTTLRWSARQWAPGLARAIIGTCPRLCLQHCSTAAWCSTAAEEPGTEMIRITLCTE